MHFNQEGSVIWEDAKTLLEVFEKTWATKTSLRKSATLILKRGPRPPPVQAPSVSSPGPSASTSADANTQRASGSGSKSESKSVSIKLSPSAPKRERTREASSVPKREKSSTPAIASALGAVAVGAAGSSAMDVDEDEAKGVKEDLASVPTDQLVAYTESKMEIWSGPSGSSAASGSNSTPAGWMAAPKVRIFEEWILCVLDKAADNTDVGSACEV